MRYSSLLFACLPIATLLGGCATTAPTATATTAPADPTNAAVITSKVAPGKAAPAAGKPVATGRPLSRFLATPPVIDGKADDWVDSLHYDAGSKFQYQVLNDNRTVYVRLKIADASEQAKVALLGLVVWLDSTGRNQQQFGVRFPMGIDLASLKGPAARPQGAMGPSAAERQAEHVARLHQVLDNAKEMELLHYKGNKEPTLTDTQSMLGVKAAATVDAQDNLVYELAVPLRLLYRHVPALASGQPALVGVWLAGQRPPAPKPGESNYDASSNGMSGGGMGGGGMGGSMGRGGMGRGGMGGGSMGRPNMQNSISTASLKTSVQLVSK